MMTFMRLFSLRVTFQPPLNNDGVAIQTVETITLARPNGNVISMWSASSLGVFEWKADIGCPIIGPFLIGVSMDATIELNPPLDDD